MYQKFQHLQGKYIPLCSGVVELDDAVGLLMEDCGNKALRDPPGDENERFILHMEATWVMEPCLAAGLVHPDIAFRNIVYDLVTLKMRVIDIGPIGKLRYTTKGIWLAMAGKFYRHFGYKRVTFNFWCGFRGVVRVLWARPLDLGLYLLILRFTFAMMKKVRTRDAGKYHSFIHSRRKSHVLTSIKSPSFGRMKLPNFSPLWYFVTSKIIICSSC